jgi:hypothetical protein
MYCKKERTTMLQETSERNGAPITRPASEEMGSANSVSTSAQKTVIIGSPFERIISITMQDQKLRIGYRSFGQDHLVYIGTVDLQRLVRDRFAPPAQVMQIREGIDGAEVTEKTGYACRTVSGKALKISTTTSGGDMVVPWSRFVDVVNHKIKSTAISRLRKSALEVPVTPRPVSLYNIREGLATGF